MTAQRRVYYRHAIYHIVLRGNNKQKILEGDQNKALFIEILEVPGTRTKLLFSIVK